jgi:hypothetical protein
VVADLLPAGEYGAPAPPAAGHAPDARLDPIEVNSAASHHISFEADVVSEFDLCWVCIASTVTTTWSRSKRPRRSRAARISLLLAAVATWPRTIPVVRSKAATRCGAGVLGVRAPQTVLPSKVMTRRPLTTWVRVQQNAATTVSETSAPTRVKARRIADSLGRVDRAAPSSMSSSMLVSLTHSPITANDQAPPSTTATPTASKPGNACRTPRGCRGSGTRPNSINRSDRAMVDAAETVVQTMTSARVILSVRSSCKNHYSSPMGHTRPTRDTTPEWPAAVISDSWPSYARRVNYCFTTRIGGGSNLYCVAEPPCAVHKTNRPRTDLHLASNRRRPARLCSWTGRAKLVVVSQASA